LNICPKALLFNLGFKELIFLISTYRAFLSRTTTKELLDLVFLPDTIASVSQ